MDIYISPILWVYVFEDGTKLELFNVGFSGFEIDKMEDLHGKCTERSTRYL